LLIASFISPAWATTVLVEAENFDDLGGWVIDQQSIDQMGSPYLLAHGLGIPVKDAATTVNFPITGTYRVWVRTKDWTAPWNVSSAPGKFRLIVQAKPLETIFGTEGSKWHWQDGGYVEIKKKTVKLTLNDLTGFEGRCDAILFSNDRGFIPPNQIKSLAEFRKKSLELSKKPPDAGNFDLVVVGGGIAGTCSSISAARLGLKVALIQDRPVLGGNNSSEVRVGLSGHINKNPYPALGNIVKEIAPIGLYDLRQAQKDPNKPYNKMLLEKYAERIGKHNAQPAHFYEDDKKLAVVKAEKNIALFLNTHAFKVEKENDRIIAVIAKHIRTGKESRFPAMLFADCTGDGTIGYLAGADYRYGRESKEQTSESWAPQKPDNMTMGTSVQWYSTEENKPVAFPNCPWALKFTEQSCQYTDKGDWNWETGFFKHQINDFESIRDYTFRAVYGNWAFLKNQSKKKARYANKKLAWVAYIGGKRESRRLLGDIILHQQDIEQNKPWPDAAVTMTWTIDLHYPDPKNSRYFPGEEFRSIAEFKKYPNNAYPLPYRCLYSRNIENLFMAGRNISVTHVALGAVRVQKTTGMMGEVIAMAASICKKYNTTPRRVYQNQLDELKKLMKKGIGKTKNYATN